MSHASLLSTGSPVYSPDYSEFGPISLVVIQGTSLCNLNCDYCYLPDRQINQQISLDLIEPILERVLTSRFLGDRFTICWHAGEPLTMPISFYQAAFAQIEAAKTKYLSKPCAIAYSIQTNATLINQAWCDFIKTHNIKVGVSLDGPEFIHDAHRKTWKNLGTHAAAMRGVSLLQKNNIDFHVISVLTRESLDYPDEMFHFFMDNGMRRIGFNVEEIEGVNQSTSLDTREAEMTYRSFIQRFWELTKSVKGALKVREFERICGLIYTGAKLERGQMTTPFSIVSIDYQGNFTTFSPELLAMKDQTYGDFVLGNVLHDSFESVCGTKKFQTLHQEIRSGVDLCQQTCQYFSVCGGGAPSNKYWENHSFSTAETRSCRLYKQVITDVVLEDFETALQLKR